MEKKNDFELFKQGAEARLHVGTFIGRRVIVKERFPKKYRHPTLDSQLTKKRLKAELKMIVRCKKLGIRTPTVYYADAENSLFAMEYLEEAKTCRDFINENRSSQGDKVKLVNVLRGIGSTLATLHNDGVIHGDLTTSNILVDKEELVMIDFGLGFAEGSPEDKGVDLYVLERAFLSTHPNMEQEFSEVMSGYKSKLNKGDRKAVIEKYEDIRMRGRKRTMVG